MSATRRLQIGDMWTLQYPFLFFFTIANLMFVASEPYKTSVLNKTPPFCFIF